MAYQSVWYFTDLPKEVIDIVEKDLKLNFDSKIKDSMTTGNVLDKQVRNSKNCWKPTSHWLGGFLWHYVERANRENFLYDLRCIDNESLQYTQYKEGEFYTWHTDSNVNEQYKPSSSGNHSLGRAEDFVSENSELIRKLSFVLQLSDPSDYKGGNLQLLKDNGESYIAPRKRGTIIFFDSRTPHRVLKVTKGVRKSIVGWTVGPRWK